MFELLNALISLIDLSSDKSTETKKDTARFVQECLSKIEKSRAGS